MEESSKSVKIFYGIVILPVIFVFGLAFARWFLEANCFPCGLDNIY